MLPSVKTKNIWILIDFMQSLVCALNQTFDDTHTTVRIHSHTGKVKRNWSSYVAGEKIWISIKCSFLFTAMNNVRIIKFNKVEVMCYYLKIMSDKNYSISYLLYRLT